MRILFVFLLFSILIPTFGQENGKNMETILSKLDALEKLKIENDSISSLDLLKKANQPLTKIEAPLKQDTLVLVAEIFFDTLTFELGSITQGNVIIKNFTFTNIGSDDLEIISVVPDCSCTSTEWTEGIIKPGQKGYISVAYDSHDDIGKFLKTITVLHTAGEGFTFLEMVGFVAPKL